MSEQVIRPSRQRVIKAAQQAALNDLADPVIECNSLEIAAEQFVRNHHTDPDPIRELEGDELDRVLEVWADAIELRDEIPAWMSPTHEPIRVEYTG